MELKEKNLDILHSCVPVFLIGDAESQASGQMEAKKGSWGF